MLGRSGLPGRSELQPGHPFPGATGPEARFSFHPSALIALIALRAHLNLANHPLGRRLRRMSAHTRLCHPGKMINN